MPNAFLRLPIRFGEICNIYPPSVNDVLTTKNYNYYHNIFTISQEEIEDTIVENGQIQQKDKIPTPFKFLLGQAFQNPSSHKLILDAFQFFCHEKVSILFDREEIWLCDLEEEIKKETSVDELMKVPKITEDNYFDFQNIIRLSLGEKQAEKPNLNEHPRVRAMKAKARLRDKIKAKQGGGINLKTSLKSICCMGLGLTPLNIGEISLSAVAEIMEMRQEKEKYEIDIESLLAGASSKKIKPKYWIHN